MADADRVTVRDDDGLELIGGWTVREAAFRPDTVVTAGSNYMTGNGYLGYRGTLAEWGRDGYVACTVSDTYDCADGHWRELTTVPNALYARWRRGDADLILSPDGHGPAADTARELDVRHATWRRTSRFTADGAAIELSTVRYASLARLPLVIQRQRVVADRDTTVTLTSGIDGDVWSLNGQHLPALSLGRDDDGLLVAAGDTVESGIRIVVARAQTIHADDQRVVATDDGDRRAADVVELPLTAGEPVVVDTIMAVATSRDGPDPEAAARDAARGAHAAGWDTLWDEHAAAWRDVWERTDVQIDGDPLAQVATRFGILHNVIATPRHSDRLPIGARGLSCQAYQGAAFWDQEMFNLPMFLHTDPQVARNLLTYRHRTLDGARRKARRLEFAGAYYAWISGDTGDELCPSFFFTDVLTGRAIRNHFDDWQIHVSPDVALAVERYVEATGDVGFVDERGAEIVFEVARFCTSRVCLRPDTGRAHVRRVLGPDEYHENVDDNAYTNHLIHEALDLAVRVHADLAARAPARLAELRATLDLDDEEVARWADVRDRLVLPGPDPATGVIEQFAGYHGLEDVTPEEVAERLQDPGEYWGWPNGVAVHTQVIKQADVVQLLVTLPERFDDDVARANLDHYEPRTQHGSSLSRSAYAVLAARLGRADHAHGLFLDSATVDLLATTSKTSGGTFIGGIRTAAAAASWWVVVEGFLGLRVEDGQARFDPVLPGAWGRIATRVIVRGATLEVEATPTTTRLRHVDGPPLDVAVAGWHHPLQPGETWQVAGT